MIHPNEVIESAIQQCSLKGQQAATVRHIAGHLIESQNSEDSPRVRNQIPNFWTTSRAKKMLKPSGILLEDIPTIARSFDAAAFHAHQQATEEKINLKKLAKKLQAQLPLQA